jgi:hypothetical protein
MEGNYNIIFFKKQETGYKFPVVGNPVTGLPSAVCRLPFLCPSRKIYDIVTAGAPYFPKATLLLAWQAVIGPNGRQYIIKC